MGVIECLVKILAWLRIAASPIALALVVGALIYYSNPSNTSIIIARGIVMTGIILGVLWATKIWKKQETVEFMARTMATPELDKKEEE